MVSLVLCFAGAHLLMNQTNGVVRMGDILREVDAFLKLWRLALEESERRLVIACGAYIEDQIKTDILPGCNS